MLSQTTDGLSFQYKRKFPAVPKDYPRKRESSDELSGEVNGIVTKTIDKASVAEVESV